MRAVLICLWMTACLGAAEIPTYEQEIVETVRALVVNQRSDGSWGSIDNPTTGATPQAINPGFAFRDQAHEYSAAAEMLWRSQSFIPTATLAATKAQLMASRALKSNPRYPPSIYEAIAFLRAEQVRGVPSNDQDILAATNACQIVLTKSTAYDSRGQTVLGLWDPNDDCIDLRLTWLARPLITSQVHTWEPSSPEGKWPRISRFQRLIPETLTDQPLPSPVPFEDGSAFAAALADWSSDAQLTWLLTLWETEDPFSLSLLNPDYAQAYLESCLGMSALQYGDIIDRWTMTRLASTTRTESPSGLLLLWTNVDTQLVKDNTNGLRWLLEVRRVNQIRRDHQWFLDHVTGPLAGLMATQAADGTWQGDTSVEQTSMACLAFLGNGYDHKTPNKFRKVVQKALDALTKLDPASGTMRERSLRTMAVCEAHAMTGDYPLREPAQALIDALWADRLPAGGWAEHPGGALDWPTTSLALGALRSAYAGGMQVLTDANGTRSPTYPTLIWWPTLVGDGDGDPLEVLAWKAFGGAAQGEPQRVRTNALTTRLCAALTTQQPDDQVLWPASVAIYQLGGAAWTAWDQRVGDSPMPTTGLTISRILAYGLIYRMRQTEKHEAGKKLNAAKTSP